MSALSRPRLRVLLVGIAGLAGLALLGSLTGVGALGDVLATPRPGEVVPALLRDGIPVFATHLDDGTVLVLDARVPGEVGPVGAVTGYCPRTLQFVDPHLGTVYDQRGRRYPFGVRGRLGTDVQVQPTPELDLRARRVQRVSGAAGPGASLLVEGALSNLRTRGAARPSPEQERRARPPAWCRTDAGTGGTEPGRGPGRRMRSHADLAVALADAPTDGRAVVVDAMIVRDPDGRARLCPPAPASEQARPSCPSDAIEVTPLEELPADGLWTVLRGPLWVRLRPGAASAVSVLPETRWLGGGFLGAERYHGLLVLVRADHRVLLRDVQPLGGGDCVAAGDGTAVLPLLPAATWAGEGRPVEPLAPGQAPRPEGEAGAPEVQVLVDRSTCGVLTLTATDPDGS